MPSSAPVTSSHLGKAERQRFQDEGFLCPIRVFNDREVAHFLQKYNDHVDRHREQLAKLAAKDRYHVFAETHFVMKWAFEITRHPRVLDAVESVIGPNIFAWSTAWFSKMPGDKAFVSWHQDGTYWNLSDPSKIVTAWVALTPSMAANGCMRVIPQTHTQPMMPQRETYAADNVLSRGQEIAVEVDEARAVDLALRPGEMSLHHIWIVHGSKANLSETPRIGMAIRYVSPEVRQESPFRPLAVLVRGEDKYRNFELEPPPPNDYAPLEAHAAVIARIRAGVLQDAKQSS